MLRWRKAFLSKYSIIDDEHSGLFTLFNRVERLGDPRSGAGLEEINKCIDELIEYATSHCALENDVMREAGYPRAEAHAREHAGLVEYLIEILRPAVAGDITIATFVKLARGRFLNHFMKEDYAFVKWSRAKHGGSHPSRSRVAGTRF